MLSKTILNPFQKKVLESPPVWFMRQAGRSLPEYISLRSRFPDFISFCLNPEAVCEATLQPIRRFEMDAAILFSDILLLPSVCGQNVTFKEKQGPCLSSLQISHFLEQTFESIEKKLEPVFDAIQQIQIKLPEKVGLIGFAGAPWTVALYMLEQASSKDFHQAKSSIFKDINLFQQILDHLTLLTTRYLERQIQSGVHVIQLFESWAHLVPAPFFEPWILKPTQQISRFLKSRYPTVPIIGFPKGLGVFALKAYQATTQVDGLSVDFSVPLEEIKNLPCIIQGNLDPSVLLAGGSLLKEQTNLIIKTMEKTPFIFNLGHGMLPQTPLEHIGELIRNIREYGASTC
ncbi:MAG: uroporphyrinogen decarboxylase [Alphaproteobacteria bacterium]